MQIHPALRQPAVLLTGAAILGAGLTGVYSLTREQRQTKMFEAERSRAQGERSEALAALSRARGEIHQLSTRLDALTAAQSSGERSNAASSRSVVGKRAQPAKP